VKPVGFLNPVLAVVVITVVVLYYSVRLHRGLVGRSLFSQARLFLKAGWTKAALTSLALSFVVFVLGRAVSFLVLFGALPGTAVDTVRNALDLASALMTAFSVCFLYFVIKPRRAT